MDDNLLLKIVENAGDQDLPTEKAMLEYDPTKHKVTDVIHRPKKMVTKPTGEKDEAGNDIMITSPEDVNRIAIPYQKLIVKRRVAFMNVGATSLVAKPDNDKEQELLDLVNKIREDNKLSFKENEVARRMCSELQVAKLWYTDFEGEERQIRLKILSPVLGDELLPVFDTFGKMVYFGRKYQAKRDFTKLTEWKDGFEKPIEHFDIYTDDLIRRFEKEEGKEWELIDSVPNPFEKIPVVYYSLEKTIWEDVQPIIERQEELISNFGDTNDYNGSPILAVTGTIVGFSAKGERGKILEMDKEAKVEYVTWQHAPEAIKLEMETLENLIYTCTQTPNISLEKLSGLGDLSGVAFDRVFLDAHLAAKAMIDDVYGECTQRDINLLKRAATLIDPKLKSVENMDIWADIPLYKVNDVQETINMLMGANGGKPVLSQETSTKLVAGSQGLDPDDEWDMVKSEADSLGEEIDNEPGMTPVRRLSAE